MSARFVADNLLRPFQLEQTALRGRVVRLGRIVDEVLTRHAYPLPVSRLLGELVAFTATLAGGLKFNGTFSLQIRSDGPVSLMVADCTNDGTMRGYAKFNAERVAAAGGGSVPDLLGAGHLAMTVDQDHPGTAYQGVVELKGETLVDCLHSYFRESEQLRTGLKIAVDQVGEGAARRWRAGGIMVQRLAEDPGRAADEEEAEEDWRRTMLLLGTATDAELVDPDLTPEALLLRLFHEEGVRVFEPMALHFGCRCSRERVETMLLSFREGELDDMTLEDGSLIVTCEFCSESYHFDPADLAQLQDRRRH